MRRHTTLYSALDAGTDDQDISMGRRATNQRKDSGTPTINNGNASSGNRPPISNTLCQPKSGIV